MRQMIRLLLLMSLAAPASAQTNPFGAPAGPPPTHADIAYAPADPAGSHGHLLDIYLPQGATKSVPVVIWTGGSGWMADSGKTTAGWLVPALTEAGYAVAGVSIRSSGQTQFPGQLHDIKAATRWLRVNGSKYGIDGNRIGIMGDSSGGWTSAIAATTGDVPELEGTVGVTGVSSAVQVAIAFYPPTRFTMMDEWALKPCKPGPLMQVGMMAFCHDGADSPESRLVGCPIQQCVDKVEAANPAKYVSAADPPIMILHGETDPLVPHAQGEYLYQVLNKACHDAVLVSMPRAGHGPAPKFLSDPKLGEAATIRSTTSKECAVRTPEPVAPSMAMIIEFLNTNLKH